MYSANWIKSVERSDSLTLGTLDHFSHATLNVYIDIPEPTLLNKTDLIIVDNVLTWKIGYFLARFG